MTAPHPGRRRALAAVAAGVVGTVTGCSGRGSGPSFPDADVVVGPEGRLVFDPETLTVSAGDTVTWGFASSGHNVSCRPEDSEQATLPEGAAPFATYGPETSPRTLVSEGETYEHTFEATGRYVYVCVPHVNAGMTGRIRVE